MWIAEQQGIHLLQGTAQSILKEKFLQLKISCFNTFLNQLWLHQLENNYSAIFLQETSQKEGNSLGNFKHWKVRMHTIFKDKSLGFGVGTLIPQSVKNVFRDDLIRDDLEIVWNEIKTEGEKGDYRKYLCSTKQWGTITHSWQNLGKSKKWDNHNRWL